MNRAEKIGFLSEMIFCIKSGDKINSCGYQLLSNLSVVLDIPDSDFIYLIKNPITYSHLQHFSERYVQFYKLMRFIFINKTSINMELRLEDFYNLGLKMGLNFDSVNQIIELSSEFKHASIPVKLVHNISRIYCN